MSVHGSCNGPALEVHGRYEQEVHAPAGGNLLLMTFDKHPVGIKEGPPVVVRENYFGGDPEAPRVVGSLEVISHGR